MSENVSAHYLGERGEAYCEVQFTKRVEEGRLLQVDYFRPFCGEERVLLDFGCADGLFLTALPARRRVGVEANPAARQRCVERSAETGCPVELYADLGHVREHTADVVISNHCLEHVPNPHQAIAEIGRTLVPGGVLALMVPFDDWRDGKHEQWHPGDADNHIFTWTPLNLGNLVSDAGLHVEYCRLVTSAWSPKILWIREWLGGAALRLACTALARTRRRRQVFCKASKRS